MQSRDSGMPAGSNNSTGNMNTTGTGPGTTGTGASGNRQRRALSKHTKKPRREPGLSSISRLETPLFQLGAGGGKGQELHGPEIVACGLGG